MCEKTVFCNRFTAFVGGKSSRLKKNRVLLFKHGVWFLTFVVEASSGRKVFMIFMCLSSAPQVMIAQP